MDGYRGRRLWEGRIAWTRKMDTEMATTVEDVQGLEFRVYGNISGYRVVSKAQGVRLENHMT